MKKIISVFILLFFPVTILSNPISWPYLPAKDYFRATVAERLFFYYQNYRRGNINIANDFRYYTFNKYWDRSKNEMDYYNNEYTKLINISSICYNPTNKLQLSLRIPFVKLKNKYVSNSGLSDVFIGISYNLFQIRESNLYISSGVKLPLGYHKYNENKIILGTGSYDIPIIINSDINIKDLYLFIDAGYIFIGKSEGIYPSYNIGKKFENGDELFGDIAILKYFKILDLMIEFNYYYVFDPYQNNSEWNNVQYKFSVTPGIIFSTKNQKFKAELGFTCDLIGKNTFSGNSPIIRFNIVL